LVVAPAAYQPRKWAGRANLFVCRATAHLLSLT
jgi:hypothetical protein